MEENGKKGYFYRREKKNKRNKARVSLFSIFLIVGLAIFLVVGIFLLTNNKFFQITEEGSLKRQPTISPAESFDPEDNRSIGYEFLDNGDVVHIWNTQDNYFFEKDAGIQLTNHYQDYWTKNVFCIGYYDGDEWNKIKCADDLSGFERSIISDGETYVNATLWKDITYGVYDLRLGVNYYLGLDDENLSITIYGKNIGIDIPFDLGFAWKVQDIDVPPNNVDKIRINGSKYSLDETMNITFKDMRWYKNSTYSEPMSFFRIYDREDGDFADENFLQINWDENLNYAVKLYSDGTQESSYVTILVDAGHFNPNQEKSTTFYWIDALTDSLVSYWKMDEGSGNIIDAHGSNDGVTGDNPSYSEPGKIGTSIFVSGDDSFALTGLTSTTQDYTFQVWINSNITYGTSAKGYLFDFQTGRMYLRLSGTGANNLGYHDNTNTVDWGTNPATDSAFHHIVMTFDSGTSKSAVYVDNVQLGSNGTYTGVNLGGTVYLGSSITPGVYVDDAYLDEIAFWERVLTTSERVGLWNSGAGLPYPLVVDITAPNVTILSPANTTYAVPINFTVNALDNNAMGNGECWVTVNASVNNHTMLNTSDNPSYYNFSAPSAYAAGGYLANFSCNDSLGNINYSESESFAVSFLEINITFPINNTNWTNVNLNVNYTNVSATSCWYSNDTYLKNTTLASCGNITNVVWSEALHNVTVWGTDGISEVNSKVSFTIDITAPEVNVTYPFNNLSYHRRNTNLTINFSSSDSNLAFCWYSFDGGTNNVSVACGLNVSRNITSVNNDTLIFWANDSAGNENSITRTWTYGIFELSQTFNASTVETSSETFLINVSYDSITYTGITGSLYYNSSIVTGTKIGTGSNAVFTGAGFAPSVSTSEVTDFYWQFSLSDGVTVKTNSTNYTQTVNPINFSLCSNKTGVPYLNFTFANESDPTIDLNASIGLGDFVYWMNDQRYNKTLSYTSTTEKPDYGFCFSPNDTAVYTDLTWKYALTGFPQRTFTYDSKKLTNLTTNETLYLLATPDGIYTTFQVLSQAEQPIKGVYVTANRTISGSTIQIGSGTTGDDGGVTFWVNPDFSHTFLFAKIGYDSLSSTITPTQSTYTVYLGGVVSTSNITDTSREVDYTIDPQDSYLFNDTTYSFNFNLTSTYSLLDRFGFTLTNGSGSELGKVSSTNSVGGSTSVLLDVGTNSTINMNYYWIIMGNYTNFTRSWYVMNSSGTEWSIKTFFDDLKTYTDTEPGMFGMSPFARTFIIFVIIFISVGLISYYSGVYSPAAILTMVFVFIALFDVGAGLIANPLAGRIDYFPTFFTGLIALGAWIMQWRA